MLSPFLLFLPGMGYVLLSFSRKQDINFYINILHHFYKNCNSFFAFSYKKEQINHFICPSSALAIFYEKEFHFVEFSHRTRLPNGNIFHAREYASYPENFPVI